MNRSALFPLTAVLMVSAGVLGGLPFLGGAGRRAVAWSGVLALGVQIPIHLLLGGWRRRADRFFAAVVVSFGVRVITIAAAILLLVVPERVLPVPFLLGLAAFVFATSVLEALLDRQSATSEGSLRS